MFEEFSRNCGMIICLIALQIEYAISSWKLMLNKLYMNPPWQISRWFFVNNISSKSATGW